MAQNGPCPAYPSILSVTYLIIFYSHLYNERYLPYKFSVPFLGTFSDEPIYLK